MHVVCLLGINMHSLYVIHTRRFPKGGSLRVALDHSTCIYYPLMWLKECKKMFEAFDLSPKYHSILLHSGETHDYMYTYKNPLAPIVKIEPQLYISVTITRNNLYIQRAHTR